MAKKKGRVPEVLWRLFHNRARTLSDTIKSLIPPPPPSAAHCLCNGRRCLGCSGANAMEFLLRPADPSDYRKLLKHCFVVVDENAPSLSVFEPHHRWSQIEVPLSLSLSLNFLCTLFGWVNVIVVKEVLKVYCSCFILARKSLF